MNSAFGARWLASLEVIIQVLFTSEQLKRNKMASRFASISEKEILSMNDEAVPKNTKMSTKFGVTVFNDKLSLQPHILRRKIKIQCLVYENCRALKSQWKQWNIRCFWACFQQQEEFNSTIETAAKIAYPYSGASHIAQNFCGILSKIKLLFGPLFIQLVWYILKQLFTSTSVNNC